MSHSLSSLVKCVRAVSFSPASKLVAAAGDSRIIALYDVSSGEQIANLAGHVAWITSLDWNDTGEYLLSGYVSAVRALFLFIFCYHHIKTILKHTRCIELSTN